MVTKTEREIERQREKDRERGDKKGREKKKWLSDSLYPHVSYVV